jgi:hypothetical protein
VKLHFRGLRPGQVRFDIGIVSHGKGKNRVVERRWLTHQIGRGSWGISFGSKLFIGFLHIEGSREVRERIK